MIAVDHKRRAHTIQRALQEGAQLLAAHQVPDPGISAEALLAFVLAKARHELYLDRLQVLDPGETERYQALLKRRARRYPLQYLLGRAAFRDADLAVGEGCLIPRPETELLVETALSVLECSASALNVLDVGTGSGNIAIGLALARSAWRITATDISERALEWARRNARANGVTRRVRCVQTDLWENPLEAFDAVISNPPYLSALDFEHLQPEVRFEPHLALDGGLDGKQMFHRIAGQARSVLKSGGFIFFEVGMGQAEAVCDLLRKERFQRIGSRKDYSGIERIVFGSLTSDG